MRAIDIELKCFIFCISFCILSIHGNIWKSAIFGGFVHCSCDSPVHTVKSMSFFLS